MDRIIVYLDDPQHAQQQLMPMRRTDAAGPSRQPTHWVLVACAPRMTQRIGKWVSHGAREKWRRQWAAKLFARIEPVLRAGGDQVTTVLAHGRLPELTRKLLAEHGACPVLDARRPKFGQDLQPVTTDQPGPADGRWQLPGAVIGMGAVLVLAAE